MRSQNIKLSRSFKTLLNSSLFIIIFLIIQPVVVAQVEESMDYKEYKGLVIDGKTKKPLEYASISVSNSNISTISNLDGVFLIKVPTSMKNEKVVITYMGFQNKTIPLSSFGADELKISMQESFEKLPDVNLVEANAVSVLRKVIERKKDNSYLEPIIAKSFYRESINSLNKPQQ